MWVMLGTIWDHLHQDGRFREAEEAVQALRKSTRLNMDGGYDCSRLSL